MFKKRVAGRDPADTKEKTTAFISLVRSAGRQDPTSKKILPKRD